MDEPFEERFQGVLQNIEFAIIGVYREQPELTDAEVDSALEGLLRTFQAELRGKAAPPLKLNERKQQVFAKVKTMCDWRLGREVAETEEGEKLELPPLDVEDIIACVKRIRKSIHFWTTKHGRRGYLDYVKEFIR